MPKVRLAPRRAPLKTLNDSTIPVDKQFIVPFKLGSYQDTIKCDIIPMKVTHILFGRPWLQIMTPTPYFHVERTQDPVMATANPAFC